MKEDPRALICELSRLFYSLGWCTGTGGGISIRDGAHVYMAPSGVQKERMQPEDIYLLDLQGEVLQAPADASLRLSACAPLFFNAYRMRDAGAVLHSHSRQAGLATLISESDSKASTAGQAHFRVTHLEMIKGLRGMGYHDTVEVPIIENTAHECDLADDMAAAIEANPQSDAVLVRRHGVYVWGKDWKQAKTQAECLDYLFAMAVDMRRLGLDPART